MKKVAIAVPSTQSSNSLKEILDKKWSVHICTDSYQTIDTLKYLRPDALVIDLNMPQKDGIAILEECFPNIPPATLALSPLINEFVSETCLSLGVKYLMPNTSQAIDICCRLEEMSATLCRPSTSLMRHLRVLEVNPHLDGYAYLLVAVPYFKEDPERLLHKEVYSYIVEQCNARDTRCVEHAIRCAIKSAWKRHRLEVWADYFPIEKDGTIRCPTIKEFIRTLSEKI